MAIRIEYGDSNSNRKKILVAVLLAIFLAVVVMRTTNQPDTKAQVGPNGTCDSNPPTRATLSIAKSTPVEQSIPPLPKVDLQQVIALDPFRSRPVGDPLAVADHNIEASEAPFVSTDAVDSSNDASQDVRIEIPVSAIVTGGKRSAALIRGKLFYENDSLENGWLIVAIKPSSILVERDQKCATP